MTCTLIHNKQTQALQTPISAAPNGIIPSLILLCQHLSELSHEKYKWPNKSAPKFPDLVFLQRGGSLSRTLPFGGANPGRIFEPAVQRLQICAGQGEDKDHTADNITCSNSGSEVKTFEVANSLFAWLPTQPVQVPATLIRIATRRQSADRGRLQHHRPKCAAGEPLLLR